MNRASPRDLVRRAADRHGDRLAVISGDERLTYRELASRTGALAAALKECGVGAGVQVGVMLPNSVAYVVSFFGILEAGGIGVPLVPVVTAAEARDLLDRAGVSFLIAFDGAELPGELGMAHLAGFESLSGLSLWRSRGEFLALDTIPWTAQGILIRQFSSGSTGRPKHLFRTEANICESLRHICEAVGLEDGERFLGVAPFCHVSGAVSLYTAFHLGGMLTVLPRFLPAAVLAAARRDMPTVYLATPPMIELLGSCLLEDGDETAFDSLKLCSCTTGKLRREDRDRFQRRFGVPVRDRYGSSEVIGVAMDLEDGFEEGRMGWPYSGVEVVIFDDDGNRRPAGTPGHIGIRSAAASTFYVDDPEATARAFRNGYAFPGDRGYLDAEGRLFLVGREDIINIGGYKVDHLEVEKIIRDALPVKDVVVLEGTRAGLPVVRAVVEADPDKVSRAMVIDACRARLSNYKVPALVEILERFERDANGKVLKATLDG